MLYRVEGSQERIVITQPTHAWLSGQLARAWGNEQFGEVVPREEVCLGAEQHDVGHAAWEQAPTFNQQTGLPYSFLELPRQERVRIWSGAARLLLTQGRYAALLVSLHGTGFYEHYDATTDMPENVRSVQSYLAQEQVFQDELLASLSADPYYCPYATQKNIARNRRLLQVWDALSLAICSGGWQTKSVSHVPASTNVTTLTLHVRNGDPTHLLVTPWPFRHRQVSLVYEGRSLTGNFPNEEMMRDALKCAHWVTLQTTLNPG
jgi:hypothetical protein